MRTTMQFLIFALFACQSAAQLAETSSKELDDTDEKVAAQEKMDAEMSEASLDKLMTAATSGVGAAERLMFSNGRGMTLPDPTSNLDPGAMEEIGDASDEKKGGKKTPTSSLDKGDSLAQSGNDAMNHAQGTLLNPMFDVMMDPLMPKEAKQMLNSVDDGPEPETSEEDALKDLKKPDPADLKEAPGAGQLAELSPAESTVDEFKDQGAEGDQLDELINLIKTKGDPKGLLDAKKLEGIADEVRAAKVRAAKAPTATQKQDNAQRLWALSHGSQKPLPSLMQDPSKPAPATADEASQTKPFKQATNGSTPAGWVQIGTPKKWLLAIFDTGSDKLVAKTWETVASELSSIDQGIKGMVLPSDLIYNHETSTTYKAQTMHDPFTGKDVPKQTSITYGSGTAMTDVGKDTIHVGNRHLKNYTLMEITADSLQLLHTSKGIAGVLGLQHMKNKSLGNSLFSQLREQNLLTSFGYCRGSGNNGTFIWGDDSTEGTELEVIGQMHWAMKLGGVAVADNAGAAAATPAATPNSLISQKSLFKSWPFDAEDQDEVETMQDDPTESDTDQDSSSSGEDSAQDAKEMKEMEDAFKAVGRAMKAVMGQSGQRHGQAGQAQQDAQPEANVVGGQMQETRDLAALLGDTCPDQKCTAILDTGSNIIAGPSEAIKAITEMVNVKQDCSNFDTLPPIKMTLGGLAVTIPPSGYVMKVPMPAGGMGGPGGDGDGDGQGGGGAGDGDGEGDGEGAGGGGGGGFYQDQNFEQQATQMDPYEHFADDGSSSSVFAEPLSDLGKPVQVVIDVEPRSIHRHRPVVFEMSLAQKQAAKVAATEKRWRGVFERIYKNSGVNLRDVVNELFAKNRNATSQDFLCMPALVPLDKKTPFGPLWVVGTPLLDAYYARWSFDKAATAPKVHLKPLQDAAVCKDDTNVNTGDAVPAPTSQLLRSEKPATAQLAAAAKPSVRGPTMRLPEEIRFPHWAKDLLHI